MKNIHPFLCCLLSFCTLFGQEVKEDSIKSISITYNPTLIAKPIPMFQFGVNHIHNNISSNLEYGFGHQFLMSSYILEKESFYRIHQINCSLYKFHKLYGKEANFYTGIEGAVGWMQAKFENTYYLALKDNKYYRYSEAFYRNRFSEVNFKLGWILRLGKKVNVDLYSGLGLRFSRSTFDSVKNEEETKISSWFSFSDPANDPMYAEGNHSCTVIKLGFKVAYVIFNSEKLKEGVMPSEKNK